MTSSQFRERIENAEKKIENKKATIAKKEKWISSGKKDAYEVEWLRDDIKRLNSEIKETEATIERYKAQLEKTTAEENKHNELPAVLLDVERRLVEAWNEHDIKERDELRRAYREEVDSHLNGRDSLKAYREFIKKHPGYHQKGRMSNEDIDKENKKAARFYVLDLYRRVEEIVGKITDLDGITCNGVALNGIVKGTEGRARVETILAGGYNIQRLHCRTLVHSF